MQIQKKERTIEAWRLEIRKLRELQESSRQHEAQRVIGAGELAAAMAVIDKRVEDPAVRARIRVLFSIRAKYDVLDEIANATLKDDPETVIEVCEAAASIDAFFGDLG